MMFKYYLIGRMEDASALPTGGLVSFKVLGSRPFDPSVGCRVCGVVVYDHMLSAQDIQRCHLARAAV